MLDTKEQSTQELEFLRTFDDMDITTQRAQLIGEIESKAQESENANPNEFTVIKEDLKKLRDQIRRLDKSC